MRAHSQLTWRTGLRAAIALAVVSTGLTIAAAPASAAPVVDGLTQATAAASCWEIKKNDSSAPSQVYWILTPQLKVPTKIYCDQTTDGGGWALIGRGRDGWAYTYDGRGTAAEVAGTVTGTAAFSPRQLGSTVIDGLMGGKRIDDLTYGSGVRVRRARNAAGTDWQESRWTFRSGSRDRWSWALPAGFPLASFAIDGATGSGTTTRNFGTDDAYKRIWTAEDPANSYTRGFTYGSQVTGSTSATSYLYSKNGGGAYAVPFSQVFIRPKLLSSQLSFTTVPDAGTAPETIRAAPRNGALATEWGVTGIGAGGSAETSGEVQAFAQVGGTVYVGGNFTTVQKGASATGSDVVAQPYLAAFDATTGAYIRSFTPKLDNQVKSLVALPGGKLAVGGEFATVNGVSRAGLVVLDPSTGAVDTGFTTVLANRLTGGKVSVRGMDVSGGYLYLTGAFTHLLRPGTAERYAKGGARISLSTGIADNAWNPDFNGTGTAIDVSDDGTTVYFSGYFTTMRGGAVADRAAAISTASGANRAKEWQPTFSTAGSARYQQAVKQVGGKVWLGGSQHSMFAYSASTLALQNTHITKDGGDLQAITGGNGLVFGGCHCENWNYSDTSDFDTTTTPGSTNISWSQADKIYYVGAWDAKTGDYAPEFTPEMRAREGRGAWALMVASDGTLWAGGTLTSAVKENGANQWVGGFARFAVRPHTAPSRPNSLAVSLSGSDARLTWSSSAPSGTTYEVLRNDRVVGLTTSKELTIAGSVSTDRFAVRSADAWGNRSASTAVVGPPAGAPVTTVPLVAAGSTWSYLVDKSVTVPSDWTARTFDAASWRTGSAALGWGTGAIATNVDVPAGSTRPLTSYFRRQFTAQDVGSLTRLTLTTRADDGIAVYVNGTEVGRSNLPSGALTPTTYAGSAPSTATALASPVTFTVPPSLLVDGTNTVAVEVHSNYRLTPSMSMDLALSGTK
ncbi:delta-60 repeat domain-containing protein [Aeromicrobium fastidiosum]|uniref:Fibrinogen C-terminal domain-containing protein n=1 Tax=Aeromicrobium fastidiosum TaxID=52699 RepID=A0A641AS70_9ACTN|nr:delta-60 repeat domain-containing protein [Aeromicrobium fastidiosum]KAA1379738.1 hypothetical protein ESP62_000525 [Aeromicrobium fastidiosum]MBP2389226.1 hypothetical protein [Aeromicrobium fastidiosum]